MRGLVFFFASWRRTVLCCSTLNTEPLPLRMRLAGVDGVLVAAAALLVPVIVVVMVMVTISLVGGWD